MFLSTSLKRMIRDTSATYKSPSLIAKPEGISRPLAITIFLSATPSLL